MLYATEGIKSDDDFNKAMVGVASVWWVIVTNFIWRSAQLNLQV